MPTRNRQDSESRRLTEFLLADIVDIAADAIICIDSEQNVTLFNEGAATIFGWRPEEIIGKPLDVLLPERVRDIHRKHIDQFRDAPEKARRMGHRSEISGLRKNGEEFPAEAAIAKVTMGDSVVFSVVLRDMTEQVQLHQRLQRAVVSRDETVSVVAHDLRNPVSAVKMLSSALLDWARSHDIPADSVEQMTLIREASLQMDRLIQDLLDVTRVEAGRLVVDAEPIAADELLEGTVRTLRPLVEEAGLELRVDLPSGLPTVNADQERIGQVLSNLIGNSIKHTPRGGYITLSAAVEPEALRVSVADVGSGISREQLPHVFDRFFQSSYGGPRTRGAGLGLPIAQGIVHAHGGRMWAESEVGKGSTFHFTLPVVAG